MFWIIICCVAEVTKFVAISLSSNISEYERAPVDIIQGEAVCSFVGVQSEEEVVFVKMQFLASNLLNYFEDFFFLSVTNLFVFNSVFI